MVLFFVLFLSPRTSSSKKLSRIPQLGNSLRRRREGLRPGLPRMGLAQSANPIRPFGGILFGVWSVGLQLHFFA